MRRRRYANSSDEPLVQAATRASRALAAKQLRAALRAANDNVHRTLKPTYFHSIPLDAIYAAVEKTGIEIDPEERACILTGRQGRASWPLRLHGRELPVRLWITWHKMENTGRYEVIGAIT